MRRPLHMVGGVCSRRVRGTYHLSRSAGLTVVSGVHACDSAAEDVIAVGNNVGVVLREECEKMKTTGRASPGPSTAAVEKRLELSRRSYLDALQPPPDGVAAVVASAAALAQQVGNQAVAQRSSEGQDDVAASKEPFSSCG